MKELKLIKGCGRTGNFIICLLNGILLAEKRKMEQLDFSCIHWSSSPEINKTLLNDFFKEFVIKINEQHKNENENKEIVQLSLDRLYRQIGLNFKERITYVQKYIKPIMKISPKILGDKDLLIHLRSGDIMVGGNPEMIQPPLEFYEKVIESGSWNDIYVITERDPMNPLFPILVEKYNAIQWLNDGRTKKNGYNFKKDFDYLIGAKHYVPCQSSLCPFVIQLSDTIKNVYVPSYFFNRLNATMNWWTKTLFKKKHDLMINDIQFHIYDYDKYGEYRTGMYQYCKRENKDLLINYRS